MDECPTYYHKKRYRDVLFPFPDSDSSDSEFYDNPLLHKVHHFFPHVDFLKHTRLSASQRKLIKEVCANEYRWVSMPKSWYEALIKNKLTTAPYFLVASELYMLLKQNTGKCDIAKTTFEKFTSRYKDVITTLMNDPNLRSHKSELKIPCKHSDGKIEGLKSKCTTYACLIGSKIKWVAVKSDPKNKEKKPIRISEAPFSQWQHRHLSHASFDFVGALEELSPRRGNCNDYQMIAHIKCLVENRFYCVSSKHGRIFHNISNLRKEYRRFIRINGKPVKNIDLRASQPAFMASMLIELYAPQAKEFYEVLKAHRLYDYLSLKYLGIEATSSYKKTFLTWLYSEASLYENLPIHKHIGSEWKELHEWVIDFKQKHGHAHLAHLMQQKESTWIFKVAQALDTPSITIHDSFLVMESEANRVEDIVNDIILDDNLPTLARIED